MERGRPVPQEGAFSPPGSPSAITYHLPTWIPEGCLCWAPFSPASAKPRRQVQSWGHVPPP